MPYTDGALLPVTHRGLKLRIVQAGISVFLICILTTVLFVALLGMQTRTERIVLLTLWAALPFMWAGSALLAWAKRDKEQYMLMPEALTVRKSGFVNGTEAMYRYDSILAVSVKQTLLGKRHNYGDVVLSVPRMHQPIVLQDVLDPQGCATAIKQHINRRSAGSSALIH